MRFFKSTLKNTAPARNFFFDLITDELAGWCGVKLKTSQYLLCENSFIFLLEINNMAKQRTFDVAFEKLQVRYWKFILAALL
jgi:hypothetical protein